MIKGMEGVLALFAAAAVLAMTGCSAPRGLNHQATRPVADGLDAPQAAAVADFARTMGEAPAGARVSTTLPVGGKGEASIPALNATYKNALGENCRRVEMRSGAQRSRGAVCQTAQGVWRYVANGL